MTASYSLSVALFTIVGISLLWLALGLYISTFAEEWESTMCTDLKPCKDILEYFGHNPSNNWAVLSFALFLVEFLFVCYVGYHQVRQEKLKEKMKKASYKVRFSLLYIHMILILWFELDCARRVKSYMMPITQVIFFFCTHILFIMMEPWIKSFTSREDPIKTFVRCITVALSICTLWGWYPLLYHFMNLPGGVLREPPMQFWRFMDALCSTGMAGFWAYESTFTWDSCPLQNFPHHLLATFLALQCSSELQFKDHFPGHVACMMIIFEMPLNLILVYHKMNKEYSKDRAASMSFAANIWMAGAVANTISNTYLYIAYPFYYPEENFPLWITYGTPIIIFVLAFSQYRGLEGINSMVNYVLDQAAKAPLKEAKLKKES